jgi:hypothetical protein
LLSCNWRRIYRVLAVVAFAALGSRAALATELKKETSAAFDRYIAASEDRIASEIKNGSFLYVDSLQEPARKQAYQELRNGQLLLQQGNAQEEGHPIEAPSGLIHDWMGLIFIPNTTLARTLAVVQDYDNHHVIYAPEVRRSKLLSRDGDHFRVYLQLYKKSLVTVLLNGDFDITYEQVSPTRVVSRSQSTRLAEVENVDQPNQRELPPNDGNGYLWRLNTYWRAEEKDGGVYIQIETIGLSRGVPAFIAWIVKPLLRSLPRGTLSSLLEATRKAVLKPPEKPAAASP